MWWRLLEEEQPLWKHPLWEPSVEASPVEPSVEASPVEPSVEASPVEPSVEAS